jgi:hypothetical protein
MGNLEGDAFLGEGPLGPNDALGDGRLRDEKCTRNLLGRQTSEQAEGERDARLSRENRMTRRENEAQQVVADVIVERVAQIRDGHLLLDLELAAELLMLALEQLASAQPVDRTVLSGGHEPSARVVRDARLRPPLERGNESILRQLLGETGIAHDPRETGDEPRRLDPPDCVDRAMGIGSRHGYRSGTSTLLAQGRVTATTASRLPKLLALRAQRWRVACGLLYVGRKV